MKLRWARWLTLLAVAVGCGGDSATDDPMAADSSATDATAADVPVLDVTDRVSGDTATDVSSRLPATYPPPDSAGPWTVGYLEEELYDKARDRPVTTRVWYPAEDTSAPPVAYFGLLEGEAVEGATLDSAQGPYPVLLFSHGFQGIGFQSHAIVEAVAAHGFLVVAADHDGNTFFDIGASDQAVAEVARQRPADLHFALNHVLARAASPPDALAGAADPSRIAVSGHSFGGWTSLVVAGATIDSAAGVTACEAGTEANILCGALPYLIDNPADYPPPPAGLRGLVALAPAGVVSFGASGLAEVRVPALIVAGSDDASAPRALETDPIFAALPPPRIRAVLEGAGHMSFTNICDIPGAGELLADFCGASFTLPDDQAHAVTAALMVAFLSETLRDDTAAAEWLRPGGPAEQTFGALTLTRVDSE